MIKKRQNQKFKIQKLKSFTLIELIIYIGIFSIMMLVLLDIFISSLKTKNITESTAYVNQDARFIFAKLSNDINNANSIDLPALGEVTSTLTLILYGNQETFRINNGNLELIDDSGTHVLNSINTIITNLAFHRLGNQGGKNSIKINITIESKALVNNRRQIINMQTTAALR